MAGFLPSKEAIQSLIEFTTKPLSLDALRYFVNKVDELLKMEFPELTGALHEVLSIAEQEKSDITTAFIWMGQSIESMKPLQPVEEVLPEEEVETQVAEELPPIAVELHITLDANSKFERETKSPDGILFDAEKRAIDTFIKDWFVDVGMVRKDHIMYDASNPSPDGVVPQDVLAQRVEDPKRGLATYIQEQSNDVYKINVVIEVIKPELNYDPSSNMKTQTFEAPTIDEPHSDSSKSVSG